MFDEAALMPKSFVNQAIARTLSVEQSKYWFNCNPEGPSHWFYIEWVLQASKKNALHLHFLMSDNPTMSQAMIKRAEAQFEGVFYERYIKGRWVVAQGLIYPMYEEIFAEPPEGEAAAGANAAQTQGQVPQDQIEAQPAEDEPSQNEGGA